MRIYWVVLGLLFSVVTVPVHAQWVANGDGQSDVHAVGCSDVSDSEFLCLELRCESGKEFALYGILTGETLDGSFAIEIDGRRHSVTGGETTFPNASSRTLLVGDVNAIVADLKRGRVATIVYPELGLKPGFDRISLRGSSKAIEAVETICSAPSTGALPTDFDRLLRDGSGKVAIGGLNRTPGCAEAKGRGVVLEVEREGAGGTISGISFRDERYGDEFINVDELGKSADYEVRLATLQYLLTPGRKLETLVRGCGAAGRIQKLVSAVETSN